MTPEQQAQSRNRELSIPHAIPTQPNPTTTQDPQNSNDHTSNHETHSRELHAKLGVGSAMWQARTEHDTSGGGAGLRDDAQSHTSAHQVPLVWRAPEGPEGLAAVPVGGGKAWPGFEATRKATRQHTRSHWCGGRRRGRRAWLRRPEHPWGAQTKTLGTGRRHDPRLGRQGTQSCNPQGVRDVGGATRPGHSQGGPDEGNDVGGGPAQAS